MPPCTVPPTLRFKVWIHDLLGINRCPHAQIAMVSAPAGCISIPLLNPKPYHGPQLNVMNLCPLLVHSPCWMRSRHRRQALPLSLAA